MFLGVSAHCQVKNIWSLPADDKIDSCSHRKTHATPESTGADPRGWGGDRAAELPNQANSNRCACPGLQTPVAVKLGD